MAAVALLLGWPALPVGEAVEPDACLAPMLTLRTCMQQAHQHAVGGRRPAVISLESSSTMFRTVCGMSFKATLPSGWT